jgi:hypothetical protein
MTTKFRKLDPFPSSGEERKTPTLLSPLERANLNHWSNIVGFSLPSPEDGNISSFRNILSLLHATVYMLLHSWLNVLVQIANKMGLPKTRIYSEFRMMDKVSECYKQGQGSLDSTT